MPRREIRPWQEADGAVGFDFVRIAITPSKRAALSASGMLPLLLPA
jgi:hypothetical protein